MTAATAPVRCIAAGLGFTEGPLWTVDGRLLVVGMSRGLLYEVSPSGGDPRVLAEAGGSPSGLAEDSDGVIWIAQGGRDGSSSLRPRAGIQRLVDHVVEDVACDGFDAPNDLAMGPDGRVWFTDPRGHAFDGEPESGRIWALDRARGECQLMAHGASFPNGLAFSPCGEWLYVAATRSREILRYGVGVTLAAPQMFARLQAGRPDGIAFDSAGNLFVAATDAGAVQVFDPAGRQVESIAMGAMVTNVCFAGDDLNLLVVTAPKGGRVLVVERPIPGLALSSGRTSGSGPAAGHRPGMGRIF